MVRRLMAGLEGKRVLDYGCGYGDLTFAISKTNPVVGIDIDPGRVAFAREQYPGLDFREFAGNVAPIPDDSFEVVLSCVVLPFVQDHQAHLLDLKRLLVKGGSLVLVSKNVAVVQNMMRRITGRPPVRPRLNVESIDCTRKRLAQSGFHIEASEHFCDPPFVEWKTPKAVFVGILEQIFNLARINSTANYFAFRARKE
jgi:ubiquinone/menaquinone biosynthesis C-methylase UbiE